MRPNSLLLATAALALGLAAPALAADREGLTVIGTGDIHAAPDTATITTGVVTQADTAREALDANTEAMEALIEVLREAGLEDRDVQTDNFSVTPRYVYSDQRDDRGYNRPPEIVGYEVSNTLSIRVRDLDDLGAVLDRAISVGANTVHGIAFSVDDPAALYRTARERAVADALDKAETYAGAAGFSLGSIRSISEGIGGGEPPRPMARMMEVAVAQAAVPVEAGELTYSITTTITWDIETDADDAPAL